MYSLLIAMIVIAGIAVVNLFLGFSAAMLFGRGPKSLREIGRRIEFRTFSPHLLLAFPGKRRSKSTQVGELSVSNVPNPSDPNTDSSNSLQTDPPADSVPTRKPINETATGDRTLETSDFESQPPEAILSEQLRQWQAEEDRTPAPSATILSVLYPNEESGDEVDGQLIRAIREVITGILRRDRKVLMFANQEFIWFSNDTSAEDAIAPTERIRQRVTHTRFDCADQTIEVSVATGIVTIRPDDSPTTIVERLRTVVAAAQQHGYSTTVVDSGRGPAPTEPLELGIEQETLSLSGSV